MICLDNSGYEVSLERRKIYVALHDAEAACRGRIRVIDEFGDDYVYSEERFAEAELPRGYPPGGTAIGINCMRQLTYAIKLTPDEKDGGLL